MLLAASPPRSALYDVVLLLHVGVVVVTVVVLISAFDAARALLANPAGGDIPQTTTRYFRSGREIAGRAIYLIPVTGLALLGLSKGAFGFGDPFVGAGITLWILAAGAAEHMVFRPGAQLRSDLHGAEKIHEEWRGPSRLLVRGVGVVLGLAIVASLLMIIQPF